MSIIQKDCCKHNKPGLRYDLLQIIEDIINSKIVTLRKLMKLYVQIQTNTYAEEIDVENTEKIFNVQKELIQELPSADLCLASSVPETLFEDGVEPQCTTKLSRNNDELIKKVTDLQNTLKKFGKCCETLTRQEETKDLSRKSSISELKVLSLQEQLNETKHLGLEKMEKSVKFTDSHDAALEPNLFIKTSLKDNIPEIENSDVKNRSSERSPVKKENFTKNSDILNNVDITMPENNFAENIKPENNRKIKKNVLNSLKELEKCDVKAQLLKTSFNEIDQKDFLENNLEKTENLEELKLKTQLSQSNLKESESENNSLFPKNTEKYFGEMSKISEKIDKCDHKDAMKESQNVSDKIPLTENGLQKIVNSSSRKTIDKSKKKSDSKLLKTDSKLLTTFQNNLRNSKKCKAEIGSSLMKLKDKQKKQRVQTNLEKLKKHITDALSFDDSSEKIKIGKRLGKSGTKSLRKNPQKQVKGKSKRIKKPPVNISFLQGYSIDRYFSISELNKDKDQNEKYFLKQIVSMPILQEDINEKLKDICKRIAKIERKYPADGRNRNNFLKLFSNGEDNRDFLRELFVSTREKKRRLAERIELVPREVNSLLITEGALRENLSSYKSCSDLKTTLSKLKSFDEESYEKIFNIVQVVRARMEINTMRIKKSRVPIG